MAFRPRRHHRPQRAGRQSRTFSLSSIGKWSRHVPRLATSSPFYGSRCLTCPVREPRWRPPSPGMTKLGSYCRRPWCSSYTSRCVAPSSEPLYRVSPTKRRSSDYCRKLDLPPMSGTGTGSPLLAIRAVVGYVPAVIRGGAAWSGARNSIRRLVAQLATRRDQIGWRPRVS